MSGKTWFWIIAAAIVGYLVLHPDMLTSLAKAPINIPATQSMQAGTSQSAMINDHIEGQPSVTADFIEKVLVENASPAAGTGLSIALVDLGRRYGIDPVWPLATFHHESNYGREGVARETHSIGNIRCTQGYICDPTGGYRSYATWTQSAEDWYHLMNTEYLPKGRTTIDTIIPVYAPTGDNNNVPAYIAALKQDVVAWRSGRTHP